MNADLKTGIIDQREARERRAEIGKEAEFYGARDGATRFSGRDALTSIVFTVVNVLQHLAIIVTRYF